MPRRAFGGLALFLALVVCSPVFSQDRELTSEQIRALNTLRQRIETIDDLLARKRIDDELAKQERAHYLAQVAQVTSQASTYEELSALCGRYTDEESALQQVWGWFTFMHLVWLIVGIMLVVALWWLASLYVVPLIKKIPRVLIEGVLYLACAAAVIAPVHVLTGGGVFALALAGCLGLLPLVFWTHHLHFKGEDTKTARVMASFLGLAWGAAAVFHGSSLIATLSLMSFSLLTGTVIIPFLGAAVFIKEKYVPGIMLVAVGLLGFYAALALTGQRIPHVQSAVEVFQPGSVWIGTLVYFAGCLVICSRHYESKPLRFAITQAIVVASGFVGLYVGSVFEVDAIRESSGSFFAFYLATKVFDLPWKKELWAWGCLLLALLLWGAALFMERHPHYFLGF